MEMDHFAEIHSIEVIASQNEHERHTRRLYLNQLFAYRISRTLIPIGCLRGLFGCPNLHPASMEHVKIVGARDVAVQGNGIELG